MLRYDSISYSQTLGRTGHHYKDGIAFKFEDDMVETVFRSIEWTPSRSGEIAPVALFDPVEIDGCTVSRASLHNLSFIKDLELHPGCQRGRGDSRHRQRGHLEAGGRGPHFTAHQGGHGHDWPGCFGNPWLFRQAKALLEGQFFEYAAFIGILAAAFISLFLGTEYSNGAIRNKVAVGHSRLSIYFAGLITGFAASLLCMAGYMLSCLAVGAPCWAGSPSPPPCSSGPLPDRW